MKGFKRLPGKTLGDVNAMPNVIVKLFFFDRWPLQCAREVIYFI